MASHSSIAPFWTHLACRDALRIVLPIVLMAVSACEGRPGPQLPASILTSDGDADQGSRGQSPLWRLDEREPTPGLASGNGTTTTASSASGIANGDYPQIYAGPRVAKEDWSGLIARYKSDNSIASWVRGEQRRVDAWMAKRFERPDRIGGWPMAYVDRASGVPLKWSPDIVEPIPDPLDTPAKKSPHGAWVALSRDYNIAQTLAAARLFRLTGQAAYGNWAMQQLDFYADNYAKWPLSTYDGHSSLYYSGLDQAVASFGLLSAANLMDDAAGTERRAKWDAQLFGPMGRDLKATVTPLSNIDLWHQCARAAIGMRLHDTALIDEALGREHGIAAIMAASLSADNFWAEGTFSYNNYVIEAISRLLVYGSMQGYAERLKTLNEQAVRLLFAPIDYRFADGSLPNPNDGIGQQDMLPERQHWMLYRVAPTYWGRAKASSSRTWESLLDPPQPVSPKPPALPPVLTRNFPSVRFAVLRAGDWQAFVHYGATTPNHYQQEMTTFELNDGLQPIARDPGTVNYASPYHQEYFSQGAANNVPLIDGAGQAQWSQGSVDTFDPAQGLLAVSQPRYLADASVTRKYRVTTQGFVEQSTIKIPSGATHRLGITFNTRCKVEMAEGVLPSSSFKPLPNVPAMIKYWSNVAMWRASAEWKAELQCAQKKYTLTVRGPSDQRVYLATVPDTPLPASRTGLYYETEGSQASFETEIKSR